MARIRNVISLKQAREVLAQAEALEMARLGQRALDNLLNLPKGFADGPTTELDRRIVEIFGNCDDDGNLVAIAAGSLQLDWREVIRSALRLVHNGEKAAAPLGSARRGNSIPRSALKRR